jgi:TolA-binding protein
MHGFEAPGGGVMKKVWLAAALVMVSAPALAQSGLEGRVGKLESEVRAIQRKVFPGGALATIEPQITPTPEPATRAGVPAASAVADLTSRVGSLEQQMATMTGQIEQAQYRLRQLEDQFAAYRKSTDARLGSAAPAGEGTPAVTVPEAPRPAAEKPAAAKPASAPAVEKSDTGDAGEDAYLYGYRLWQAKRYTEAQDALKKVVATYPKHRRASYAQNLLGRSYLDDGKPSLASIAFYDSYKKFPDGERAPDSLYYLGQSLVKLNKPADACKVYGELTDVYGATISASMKTDVAKARTAAKCK